MTSSPMYLKNVYGALCEKLNTFIYYDDNYFYILDLSSKMYVDQNAYTVTHVNPNIIFSNDPKTIEPHYSVRKRSCHFSYEELFSLICNNYGNAILCDGTITNYIGDPEDILRQLELYGFMEYLSKDDIALSSFKKLKLNHKVDNKGLYVFIHDKRLYNIDYEKISTILTSLNSMCKNYNRGEEEV